MEEDDRERVFQQLMDTIQDYHIAYGGFLANHLTHILLAIKELGGTIFYCCVTFV